VSRALDVGTPLRRPANAKASAAKQVTGDRGQVGSERTIRTLGVGTPLRRQETAVDRRTGTRRRRGFVSFVIFY
jgi:hypothetical protein